MNELGTPKGLSSMGERAITLESCKQIKKGDLRNLINYLHFQDETVSVHFVHNKTGSSISLDARPKPCLDDQVSCAWEDLNRLRFNLDSYGFKELFLRDGKNLIALELDMVAFDQEKIWGNLPEFGLVSANRHIIRRQCMEVSAGLLQNGALYKGYLRDYSPSAFGVELSREPVQSFTWINRDQPVVLMLEREGVLVYSGDCTVVRGSDSRNGHEIMVLQPVQENLRRFPPKEFRSMRHKLNPSPSIVFTHPLTGKLMHLQTFDVSSSGVSVEELNATSSLVPGLIIPEISISIAGSHSLTCSGQVLYRDIVNQDNGNSVVRSGIAFLDMSIHDQLSYSSLLHRAVDGRAQVGSSIDLDELWKLFFTSGFIYPEKYASIWPDKEAFKETYRKLYLESPSIARHFMFQDRGRLYAHMSMIRFYGNSWIIHHHVGGKEDRGRSGVMVLDQVGFYVNEFHSLISTRMHFVMCYYREENRFPDRVFGGVARNLENPKASSLDQFAYLTIPNSPDTPSSPDGPVKPDTPGGLDCPGGPCGGAGEERKSDLTLSPAGEEDLIELQGFYESRSGGLTLDALDLKPGFEEQERCINKEFEDHGFRRARVIYALKRERELCAVITVTSSELGLNLSNLTNCMHIFLLEPIPYGELSPVLEGLASSYRQEKVSALIYPMEYVDENLSVYEKNYTLWTLNLKNSDGYFRSLQKTFRRSQYDRRNQQKE
jgi:hypothetical protein